MDTAATLLAFSEWLEGQGYVGAERESGGRTHTELVEEFIYKWESDPEPRAPLAGREGSVQHLIRDNDFGGSNTVGPKTVGEPINLMCTRCRYFSHTEATCPLADQRGTL